MGRKLLFVMLVSSCLGCATYSDIESLKSRVAKIEKDLGDLGNTEETGTVDTRLGNHERHMCSEHGFCGRDN